MVKIVSAIGLDGEYGYRGGLPWPSTKASKADMHFFRKITDGKTVIMGYNTWRSIGSPLPNRKFVVIGEGENQKDLEFISDLKNALLQYPEGILIGGAKTIELAIEKYAHLITEIIINQFRDNYKADTYLDLSKIPNCFHKKRSEFQHYDQIRYVFLLPS